LSFPLLFSFFFFFFFSLSFPLLFLTLDLDCLETLLLFSRARLIGHVASSRDPRFSQLVFGLGGQVLASEGQYVERVNAAKAEAVRSGS